MERKKVIIAGIIGVVVIALLFLVIYQPRVLTQISGVSALSLSKVDLVSSTPYFSGESWLFEFRPAGSGISQKAVGYTVTPEEAGDKYSGSEKPLYDFELNAVYNQKCRFRLKGESSKENIYKYELKERGIPALAYLYPLKYCRDNPNYAQCNNPVASGRFAWSNKCYCVDKIQKNSVVGSFYQREIPTKIDITVSSQGQTATGQLDTTLGTGKQIGNNVYVVYQGDLVASQDNCPYPDVSVYTPIYTTEWSLFSSSKYNSYQTSRSNFEDNLERWTADGEVNRDTLNTELGIVNSKVDSLLVSTLSYGLWFEKTSVAGAYLEKDPTSFVQYPITTAYIKADWIGIYTSTPDFKIVSTGSECFRSTDVGTLDVKIRNDGESGSYNVYAVCGIVQSVREDGTLDKGQERTINLKLAGTTDKEIKESCTVYVESTAGTLTAKQEICLQPAPASCKAGQKWCEENKILECGSDGLSQTIVQTCDGICVFDKENNPICSEKGQACKSDSDCDDKNPLTEDKCEGLIVKKCTHKEIGITCQYNGKTERTTPESCCNLQGGTYSPPVSCKWYQLLCSEKEGKCSIPKVLWWAILMIIIGLFGAYLGKAQFMDKGKDKEGKIILFISIGLVVLGLLFFILGQLGVI